MYNPNTIPYCNRRTTREVERYRRKHPKLTFTQAYNKLYNTTYSEPESGLSTTIPSPKDPNSTTVD